MRKNFYIYTNIFLIIFGNILSLKPVKVFSKIDQNQIPIEYLKNLPANDYIIGPGDSLNIIFNRTYPELNTLTRVDGEGTIYVPRLNRIYVQGLTINELNNLLDEALKEFVKFPETEVQIVKYRPLKIFVEGEVKNPGIVNLTGAYLGGESDIDSTKSVIDLKLDSKKINNYFFPTVFDAIRQSGGITEFSDLSDIQVIRKNNISDGGGKIFTSLNFEKVILEGDNTQNIRIYDSDIIRIKKSKVSNSLILRRAISSNLNSRFSDVFVAGRVNKPGNIKVSKASALNDAIVLAGGAKVIRGPITFIRFNNDGSIDKRKISYKRNRVRGEFNNPVLRDGDMIFVAESFLSITNEVLNEITTPIRGFVSTYALYELIRDL